MAAIGGAYPPGLQQYASKCIEACAGDSALLAKVKTYMKKHVETLQKNNLLQTRDWAHEQLPP